MSPPITVYDVTLKFRITFTDSWYDDDWAYIFTDTAIVRFSAAADDTTDDTTDQGCSSASLTSL
jgi:hypothetical protein